MISLDERTQVKKAIREFTELYGRGTYPGDNLNPYRGAELMALDPETATAAEVAKIIGKNYWFDAPYQRKCGECGTNTWDLVQVGEEPDYDSETAEVCADCLRAALRLIERKADNQEAQMNESYGEQWDNLFQRAAKYPGVRLTLSASEVEDEMDYMSEAGRRTMAGLLLMLRDSWDRAQKYSDALSQNPVEY